MSQLDQQTAEIVRHEFTKSLLALSKIGLGYKDVNIRTHGEIISCLESDSKRKMIVVPRGCLKSSLACVAYPIRLLLKNPNLRILIDSELYTNSSTFLREIKQHLTSGLLPELFGPFKSKTWNEGEIIINQRTIPRKEASITVGGVETTKVGQHYDVIIGDDYNSQNNTNSPENAAKVVNHYQMNTSILEPEGTYVIIATRYAATDLIGHIIDNELSKEQRQSLNLGDF